MVEMTPEANPFLRAIVLASSPPLAHVNQLKYNGS